jgi:hypothetical protein
MLNQTKTIFTIIAIVAAIGLVAAVAVQSIVISQQASARPTGSAVGPFHGCRQGSEAFHNTHHKCIHRD